ncbi:2481_t:CDS:2 [Diversispora eburnea]|uniref:2481_t:CDS:1 n=1 Tax=Diversispora eburnea TaxID=1213867 RepID=A0A9N9ACT9_9GLOM|nr:2481_t:CDS:2 [Diversispora eburnea]
MKHLKKQHSIRAGISRQSTTIDEMFGPSKQHPFTIVEEEDFINFVYSLYPNAEIPSADTIKREIMELYVTNVAKMQTVLQKLQSKISFTTDIWVFTSMKSFMSITVHFIDNKWQIQNIIIDFVQIYGSHTGSNIKNSFVSGVTTDNAFNNNTFIHSLNNWAKEHEISSDEKKIISDVLHISLIWVFKLRELMTKVHASPQRHEKLSYFCKFHEVNDLKPILDVAT